MSERIASCDRTAWLRPYWAELHKRDPFFPKLAPELQQQALADAVAVDQPQRAVVIREWNPATTRAILSFLDQARTEQHTVRQVELWRACKDQREVRCVALHLPTGIDVRLLERNDWHRTQLVFDGPTALGVSDRWLRQLVSSGYRVVLPIL